MTHRLPRRFVDMTTPGTLIQPKSEADRLPSEVETGFLSVVVPVVERADDLVAVYRSFAEALEELGQPYEFVFVFDGRFTPPAELVSLSREIDGIRILRFAREFGETAALRLGIEKSR